MAGQTGVGKQKMRPGLLELGLGGACLDDFSVDLRMYKAFLSVFREPVQVMANLL